MSLCINPLCYHSNADELENCQYCDSSLIFEGKYRVLKSLSTNDRRLTDVYEVVDLDQGIHKILKVLVRTLPKMIQLFQREAQVLDSLYCSEFYERIPRLDTYFTFTPSKSSTEIHCLIIEKIEGLTLSNWIANGNKLSSNLAINWFKQLLEIIQYLHSNHYIHRDINPANILLKPDGKLALIDFGGIRNISSSTYLIKLAITRESGSIPNSEREITALMTLGYTPLEQMHGKAVVQSDFYALGRTMVHLMTGYHPTQLQNQENMEILNWHEFAKHIHAPILDYIDKLIDPSPLKRPKNTQDILNFLTEMLPKQIRRNQVFKSKIFRLICLSLASLFFIGGLQVGRLLLAERSFNAGLQQLNSNRFTEARRSFEQSISLNPTYEAYANLGFLCDRAQDKKCTLDSYTKAISLNPKDYAAYYNLATYYEDQGDVKSAIAAYRKSIEVSKGQAPEPLNNLARVLILQRRYQEAQILTEQGLNSTQDSHSRAILLKNQGWILFSQRKYVEAQGILEQSNDLESGLTSSHCLLAQVLEAQKLTTAKAQWKLCLSIQGEDASSPEVSHWRSIPIDRLTNEI